MICKNNINSCEKLIFWLNIYFTCERWIISYSIKRIHQGGGEHKKKLADDAGFESHQLTQDKPYKLQTQSAFAWEMREAHSSWPGWQIFRRSLFGTSTRRWSLRLWETSRSRRPSPGKFRRKKWSISDQVTFWADDRKKVVFEGKHFCWSEKPETGFFFFFSRLTSNVQPDLSDLVFFDRSPKTNLFLSRCFDSIFWHLCDDFFGGAIWRWRKTFFLLSIKSPAQGILEFRRKRSSCNIFHDNDHCAPGSSHRAAHVIRKIVKLFPFLLCLTHFILNKNRFYISRLFKCDVSWNFFEGVRTPRPSEMKGCDKSKAKHRWGK